MGVEFHRDSAGVEQILKSAEVAALMSEKAQRTASNVRLFTGAEVVVDSYLTDRAASSVTIRDRRGRLLQARDGVLTRAAAMEGLEVTER
jgi:hypothetical protein